MKSLVRSFVDLGKYDKEASIQGDELIARIDHMAEFHKVRYPKHLGQGVYHSNTSQNM